MPNLQCNPNLPPHIVPYVPSKIDPNYRPGDMTNNNSIPTITEETKKPPSLLRPLTYAGLFALAYTTLI